MTMRLSTFIVLLAAVSLLAVGCMPAAPAGEPTQPPSTAAPASPQDPGGGGGDSGRPGDPNAPTGIQPPPVDPGPGDGAIHVEPVPGIVDPTAHTWDHITVAPDGRTLTVYYWGGVEECYGLAGVDVQQDADGLTVIRVLEGRRGELPPDTACIEIALLKAATVELEEPIVAPSE
jgi:hypothetical protein